MKLGVAGLLPSDWRQIDSTTARRVRDAGFLGAQWFVPRPLEADPGDVARVRRAFQDGGLEIAQLNGSYERLVDIDPNLRAEGVRGLNALIRLGAQVFAPTVYVRPGSLNPRSHWGPHPANHTPETFTRLVDSLRQVCAVAEHEGVLLAIEGHVLSPLDTPYKVRELLDVVGSPALKFNTDPVNFIRSLPDVYDTRPILNELYHLLGKETLVAHAKDVSVGDPLVLHIDEVLLGTGCLDYKLFLRQFQACASAGWIEIEHLPDEKVPMARQALLRKAEEAGVPLDY